MYCYLDSADNFYPEMGKQKSNQCALGIRVNLACKPRGKRAKLSQHLIDEPVVSGAGAMLKLRVTMERMF
jgi:hypothetical protein